MIESALNKIAERCDLSEDELLALLKLLVKKKKKSEELPSAWKNDFSLYLQNCKSVYDKLINDDEYIQEMQRLNVGIDILMSLYKAYKYYWYTEEGWKYKKGKKSNVINWKMTFTNALTLSCNQVRIHKSYGNSATDLKI